MSNHGMVVGIVIIIIFFVLMILMLIIGLINLPKALEKKEKEKPEYKIRELGISSNATRFDYKPNIIGAIVDEEKQMLYLFRYSRFYQFPFQTIKKVDVLFDDAHNDAFWGALAGDALFGAVGAIGGANAMQTYYRKISLMIYTNTISNPQTEIELETNNNKIDLSDLKRFSGRLVHTVELIKEKYPS